MDYSPALPRSPVDRSVRAMPAKPTSRMRPTHLDGRGHVRVVDVGDKPATRRKAIARATVQTTPRVTKAIRDGKAPKGDIAAVARVAALMGAKKTSELIPLCHPLALTHLSVDVVVRGARIVVEVSAECVGPTGVEMEAMTGASIAALTVYDMIKGMDRGARIESVELLEKSGGRSGTWKRS